MIAHRGASADEPEHTRAVYIEAIKAGAVVDEPADRERAEHDAQVRVDGSRLWW